MLFLPRGNGTVHIFLSVNIVAMATCGVIQLVNQFGRLFNDLQCKFPHIMTMAVDIKTKTKCDKRLSLE